MRSAAGDWLSWLGRLEPQHHGVCGGPRAGASPAPIDCSSALDWGWYKQSWVRWKHKEIGNPYTEPSSSDQPRVIAETLDAQLTWLDGFL